MNQEHLLRRILLIDERSGDDTTIIQALMDEISGLDIQKILSLDSWNQAIATLNADLVIICDPLSWITGIELVHLLKARSHCPIIMVAESGNLEVAVAAMKVGLDDYVVQSADDIAPLLHSIRNVWQKVQSQCNLASADLAKRQRAEVALRESETRFRNLAANVPGVICQYVLHPDGSDEFFYMSPGSQSLWELEATEIERDVSLVWNLVHPDDALALQKSIFLSAQSFQPWLWEWRIITPSGLLKWVRGAAQPKLRPNGDIIWDGLLMDISDRKASEKLLQQQFQQTQALNRVVQSIRNSLDLPTIFATSAAEVTQLLNVHRTTISQYVPDRSCWRVVACHRLNEALPDAIGLEIPDQGNLFASQIKQFQIVQIDGIDQISDPVNQEIARRFPGIIWLIIPIVLNGKIWGALSLSKPQQTAPWKAEEREIATKVTDQLEIAIQQAQLYEQAQQELIQRQQAEADLQCLNQKLEERVQERTQQFLQESQLREQAETKFQKVFHTSPHAIIILTLHDRRILEINEAFSQLFGYSREEMAGHHIDEFTLFANPADQGMVQRHLMANGSVCNLECIYRTRTGEVRTAIVSAEFIDVDGIPCALGVANDITERQQAEAALQQSEARFQKIAAASPGQIYILVTRPDGSLLRFDYVSPAVWELRELPAEHLLQDPTPIYNQIHPDDRAAYFALRDRSLATMEPFFHEYRIVTPSGQVKCLRASSRPERQENDEIFWYGLVLDVSDRKQVEEALRQSEERWQLAVQGSNEGIWDWNIKTDEAFRSDRFYEILGCFKQDLGIDEQSWVGSIHPEDAERVMQAKQDYLAQKISTFTMEYRMRCHDNTYKWVQDRAVAIWDEQGNPVRMVGSLGDISDRKQIEEQLRASVKEKEILLREVYHRVKNNMQMVSSLLNLQAASDNDPVVLRLIAETQQRVRTMALIHERLYRSKNLARINVTTYVEDLVNNLVRAYTTTKSSIQVVLELGDFELDLDTAVPCGLIINELVSNALKYAFPNQQGEIKLQFWSEDTGNYYLVVKDNGIGIPAHIDPQHTSSLGMQLIYGLTDQLRGIVELDRRGGSQFRITFRNR